MMVHDINRPRIINSNDSHGGNLIKLVTEVGNL